MEYSPNISRNPRDFFGVWTPEGWRTHRIEREATTEHLTQLGGDGSSARFKVSPNGFLETVHNEGDPFSDGGIYPSVPRVEYPPGQPRWAVSHTFLAYPVADQSLYEQEYTWTDDGTIETHFRNNVPLEAAVTDSAGGFTVKVPHTPISTAIAGNKAYGLCNSAVRGVWDNPEKTGKNYYVKDRIKLCSSLNAVYITVPGSPVVQCLGIWKAAEGDELAFDQVSGLCIDRSRLIDRGVPLDCPKLGSVGYSLRRVPSAFYGGEVEVVDKAAFAIDPILVEHLQACRDIPFQEREVGFSAWGLWDHARHILGEPGYYACHWDFNENGVVDAEDEAILKANLGRVVRVNYYSAAYFGSDWLSTGVLLNPEMTGGEPLICYWKQGGGYDAATGAISLFDSPGPNRPVYVEYHHEMPAESGSGNVLVRSRCRSSDVL